MMDIPAEYQSVLSAVKVEFTGSKQTTLYKQFNCFANSFITCKEINKLLELHSMVYCPG